MADFPSSPFRTSKAPAFRKEIDIGGRYPVIVGASLALSSEQGQGPEFTPYHPWRFTQKRQESEITAAGGPYVRRQPEVHTHKAKGTAALIRFRTWLEF